ncbi:DUF262 domain-containing protein [Luteimonas sp. Sa2BVA3]|uniref:DUF262 domain-containing protein n=1 Tax=Luteimonas colneyensis TaxID=2762230 RepID=A0ABR8UFX1_9GAMM|nr:DUF262 domain-containing protein [Luteimonas colneyensis]MBD7986926.1 DUF262 domain-containing protein [Luteimonas colneyensis]
MSGLKVEAVGISQLLSLLRDSSWLVPSFQRDFVWSESDVVGLVHSVIEARPIGMATLWEQPDGSELSLEAISIPDSSNPDAQPVARFSDVAAENRPRKFFAILDGRQRCTALAMAFGGLRAQGARSKFSGRYFLDVRARDDAARIAYLKEVEIVRRGLTSEAVAIANGLFPLASYEAGEELFPQWMRYLQAIRNPANYPGGVLPDPEELDRRDVILKQAFSGINKTLLAVYVVPQDYGLGDICEIFETLNTTGTKVSTVDLLHSWLYNDTVNSDDPVLLRDWIDELGQMDGAVGWADKKDRPELVAQAVTACYIALDSEKAAPRRVGRRQVASITSVKAGDLLATPPQFWNDVIAQPERLASYFGSFQNVVAGGSFGMKDCPYPVSSVIFLALRWYMDNDARFRDHWTMAELDAAYRAFFWINSLTGRYDQGFLTQSAADLKFLKELLYNRAEHASFGAWASIAQEKLDAFMERSVPARDHLVDRLTDKKPSGAFGKALALPMIARAHRDLLDPSVVLEFPSETGVELHHIYPRDWCKNNAAGSLASILNLRMAGRNYCESLANMIPLSRESNLWWRSRVPSAALHEKAVSYDSSRSILERAFISSAAFEFLVADEPRPKDFWDRRATDMADYLLSLTRISG